MSEPRINLMNLGVDELTDFAVSLGEKPFRATQFLKWIYQYGVTDFDLMTNIKKDLREKLKEIAYIKAPEIVSEQRSSDGTVKWALDIGDGQLVETVLIPAGATVHPDRIWGNRGRTITYPVKFLGLKFDCNPTAAELKLTMDNLKWETSKQ